MRSELGKDKQMETINQLINEIYEDNYSHLEFEENMGGEACKCNIHEALNLIAKYAEIKKEANNA
jgi:hypothetical protein